MRCPILPLTDEGFNAALAALYPDVPDEVRQTMGIQVGDAIARARKALGLQESGYFDRTTMQAIRSWATERNLFADDILVGVIGPVTTCRIYRSLGVSCASVYVMPQVTPNQESIIEAIRAGWRFECLGQGPGGIGPGMLISLGLLAIGGYLAYRIVKG